MLKLSLEFCETYRFSTISLSFIQIQQKTYNIVCHNLLKAMNTIKKGAEFPSSQGNCSAPTYSHKRKRDNLSDINSYII